VTVRRLRFRDLVWILPAGALVASLGWPGTEVIALTDNAIAGLAAEQVQRTPGAQSQTGPAQAGRGGNDPRQGPPRQPFGISFEWWNDEAIKKDVGLTEEKVKKINDIYQDRMRQMKPSADEWMKQLDLLDRMTAERMADDATYSIQVNRVESLGMRLRESRTLMLYRMYKQLQPDQYQRLRAALERMFDRNGRGRGGFSHTR